MSSGQDELKEPQPGRTRVMETTTIN